MSQEDKLREAIRSAADDLSIEMRNLHRTMSITQILEKHLLPVVAAPTPLIPEPEQVSEVARKVADDIGRLPKKHVLVSPGNHMEYRFNNEGAAQIIQRAITSSESSLREENERLRTLVDVQKEEREAYEYWVIAERSADEYMTGEEIKRRLLAWGAASKRLRDLKRTT